MIIKLVAFVVVAIIVVAALWFSFEPHRAQLRKPTSAPVARVNAPVGMGVAADNPAQAARNLSTDNNIFELVMRDGRLISGPAVLQVHEGDHVTLYLSSNRSDELHLHGYDLHARVKPGETTRLEFGANRTGRFSLELHEANAAIGALEVYPR